MKKTLFTIVLLTLSALSSFADEGMWLVSMLSGYPIERMHEKGFMLNADDIYNINHASMKDAVLIFGRGCTGEIISPRSLVLTNHHCGYWSIQSVSTVDHDYLRDGFWAMSDKEEIPIKGLTVTFLDRIFDVTNKTLKGVKPENTETQRQDIIKQNSETLINEYQKRFPNRKIVVKPFFKGNQYFLFVYKVYKDIRLVGAPPSSIGKFGGDTDNWMWPRHTGDFSLFRIYADKNGEPAEYSPENIPLKPKKFFEISLAGYKENDFTMVMGYPGRTNEYLPAVALQATMEMNKHGIKLRRDVLDIYDKYMQQSHKIKLQYSAKYARVANYWKKWIGENKGLERTHAIEKKKEYEKKFLEWTKQNHRARLSGIFEEFEKYYKAMLPYEIALYYAGSLTNFCDLLNGAYYLKMGTDKTINKFRSIYKNFYLPVDKDIFTKLLYEADKSLPDSLKHFVLTEAKKKYKGNFKKYADYVFTHTLLTDTAKFFKALRSGKFKPEKDELVKVYNNIDYFLSIYKQEITPYLYKIDSLQRIYMKAQMDFEKDKYFYPDANFTMRVAFGQVKGYSPYDGAEYNYFTTLKGVIEKEDTAIYDYKVPEKLKEIYYSKDYGRYADKDGTMHVCFIATNHTTGGNSGSPVFNKEGRLIGVNFDRNWEGTMSDLNYDPSICRNIILDIRYFLLIVDKFAGDKRLVDEMVLVE